MSNPATILDRCRQLGLTVWAEGDRIGISPPGRLPDDLRELIIAAKPGLLSVLREGAGLRPDEIPWLHIAKEVLLGEFDGANRSTRESLCIGLNRIAHPLRQRALERLKAHATTR